MKQIHMIMTIMIRQIGMIMISIAKKAADINEMIRPQKEGFVADMCTSFVFALLSSFLPFCLLDFQT